MFKKFFLIISLLVLANCGVPGSAMLGPIFTGATTGSAAQTSLSFTTNQILKKAYVDSKENIDKNNKKK